MANDFTTPAEAVVYDLGRLYDGGGEHWYRVVVRTPPGWPRQSAANLPFPGLYRKPGRSERPAQFGEDIDSRPQIPILTRHSHDPLAHGPGQVDTYARRIGDACQAYEGD